MQKSLRNKKLISVPALFLSLIISDINTALAQYEPQFTQYLNNELFINPGYAGSRGYAAAGLLYRDQWVGVEGAPKTATFTFHTPMIREKAGIGISILNDRIGVSNHTGAFLNYAYHMKTDDKGTLSFGLQGGLINVQEKLLDVITIDEGDPEFANNIDNKLMPNFGFGMYYHTDRLYAGVSIPRFLENKIEPTSLRAVSNKISMEYWHYYIFSAYVLDVSESIKLKPTTMIKIVSGAPIEADININALFKETFWLGVGFRTGDAIAFLTQFQITKQLRIGYSYDYTLTKLQNYNSGTHEFTVGYDFTFDKAKVVTPRYF